MTNVEMVKAASRETVAVDYTLDENGSIVLVVDGRRISNVTACSVSRDKDDASRIEAKFVLRRK